MKCKHENMGRCPQYFKIIFIEGDGFIALKPNKVINYQEDIEK